MSLSILVPCYNEEKRAKNFLNELIDYAKKELKNYEIILIDDGSKDNTRELLKKLESHNVKVVSYKPNKGKGFAIKTGIEASKNENILFIDADGSIEPYEIKNMLPMLEKYDVVIGDRYSDKSKITQPPLRALTGNCFNAYVNLLYNINIKDTLCGFKGFKKEVALNLFKNLKSNRWIFDVEILYKIRKQKYKLYKLPIKWTHKDDSKMSLTDPLKMALELLKLRIKI